MRQARNADPVGGAGCVALLGFMFMLPGALVVAGALGIIRGRLYVSPWLVGTAGLVLSMPGLCLLVAGIISLTTSTPLRNMMNMVQVRMNEPRIGSVFLGLFGLGFVLSGVYSLAVAYGFVHVRTYAPPWVITAVGLAFLTPGLYFMAAATTTFVTSQWPGKSPLGDATMIATVLTCMAVAFGGVALFGDPRGFYGFTLTGTTTEKRFWFGLAAVVLAAFAGLFWVLLLAAFQSREARRRQEGR